MVYLLIVIVFGVVGYHMAENKNRNATGWAVGGAVFPPVLLVLLALPPLEGPSTPKFICKCPFCAETIKAEAIVCRYCGRDLPKEFIQKRKALLEEKHFL